MISLTLNFWITNAQVNYIEGCYNRCKVAFFYRTQPKTRRCGAARRGESFRLLDLTLISSFDKFVKKYEAHEVDANEGHVLAITVARYGGTRFTRWKRNLAKPSWGKHYDEPRGGEGEGEKEHVTDVRSVAAPFLLPFSSHFFILLFLLARVPHYVRPSRSRSERSRGVRDTYSRVRHVRRLSNL